MGAEQYQKEMDYLRSKANNGTLSYSDNTYQWLAGKRNVREVDSFLKSIEPKMK